MWVSDPASIECCSPARRASRVSFDGTQMSTPLIERPEEDLETAIGEVEGRKQVIAAETLRRRYLAKGWSDWIARLRIFALRNGLLKPGSNS